MNNFEEPLDLPIVEDASLDGAASIAESMDADDVTEFQRRLTENDVRISEARADFLGGAKRLLDRLRGRKLIEDLGVHPVRVDWLGFHVPHGGTGNLKLAATTAGESMVRLVIMGFGGGSRRNISLSAERDFGVRTQCFYIGVALDVHLRAYAENGANEVNALQVDVVKTTGSYLRPEPVCPLCFAMGGHKPARARSTGRGWDLSADGQGITETISFELSDSWEWEVGFELPFLDTALTPSASVSRSVTSSCSATYEFPGGYRFTSYELIGQRLNLPFWGQG